jgi:nitrogen fixation/metabolism regulation signal transduction histidine kinase
MLSAPNAAPDTWFAPAGRSPADAIDRDAAQLQGATLLQAATEAMPVMTVILNGHRQIVAANHAVTETLNIDAAALLGKRPGEVIGCTHCNEGPDGCGTAKCCSNCGAVLAILESQTSGGRVTRECRVLQETPPGSALDLRVTATAFEFGGHPYTIFAIQDISNEKRLAVLRRIFFHDVMNTAGCIRGYAHYLLSKLPPGTDPEIGQRLANLSAQLVEEIQSQRDLISAEAGELDVAFGCVQTTAILHDLHALYCKHAAAESRSIELHDIWDGVLVTDPRLLSRVLGNMLKNALEATAVHGTVTIHCRREEDKVLFAVHNSGALPESVQSQIFQRSFSTKGDPGRGIGTHSMKLLGERYLGGSVSFTSREAEGTVFTITLPRFGPQ